MNNSTNYYAQPFTQQQQLSSQSQISPGTQASSQQLQDIQAKMLMANYARQQQHMQNIHHAATMRVAASSGALSTSPTSSTGPGAPSVASIGGVSPVQPNPQHHQQSSSSSQHGTPAPQSNSRPPSAAGGPLVNGSRNTSASPYVQSRHIPAGPGGPGPSPSPAQPNGQLPDFYQQQQRAPSAMGNHAMPDGTGLNGPGMSMQQQQQIMMNRQAGSIMPGQGGYDPRAAAQSMMMSGSIPNMPQSQQQQIGVPSNGGIPLRHPQQQNQQGHQGTNARRGPSMPPPGAPSSSAGSPMVRAMSTVPNPQQQQQQQEAAQTQQQNNLNQPPALSHSSSSSSLASDAFSQQHQMQNGVVAGAPRNSVPDVAFLSQQQQLRAAAAALANSGPQPMQMPSLAPMHMQQMMNGRNGPTGPTVNGIPQQPGAPGGTPGMDSLSSLALQSFGHGLDQGLTHRAPFGHTNQPQQPPSHPHPQQQPQQQQGAPSMPMSGMQGMMNANKMMPPPAGPMTTPRMGATVPPGFPQHHTPQHPQHPHAQQSPHGPPGPHAQQGHMMPPPSHHPGQMLPPQQPHGHAPSHAPTGSVALPGGGPISGPPTRHGPGGAPVGAAHPSSHPPGHHSAGVGHSANILPLGPHPPTTSSLTTSGATGIPGAGPGALLAPLAQGGPSAHDLLHQLDQVRLIQRQHEIQLRQEHAHTYCGAGTGTTREYAMLLRDIMGNVNPKYPTPSGPHKDTSVAYPLQKGKKDEDEIGSAERGAGGKNKENEKAMIEEKELPPPAVLAQTLEQIYAPLKDINKGTTRISVLPRPSSPDDVTHGGALRPLSPPSIKHIKEVVMRRDEEYELQWRDAHVKMDAEIKADVGGPLKWWERDASVPPSAEEVAWLRRTRLEVLWPQDGRAAREKRRKKPEIKLLRPSRAALRKPEELVPIRVDIEQEGHRLRETFVWNINDSVVSPEMFAQLTCDDLELPLSFKNLFVQQVKTQIAEYHNHKSEHPQISSGVPSTIAGPSTPKKGVHDRDDELWWTRWRKRIRIDEDGSFVGVKDNDAADAAAMPPPMTPARKAPSSTPVPEKQSPAKDKTVQVVMEDDEEHNHEMRVFIKLDITVNSVQLTDQFEWDVSDLDASPEKFAETYAADLGLSGEFTTAIAHDIREQVMMFRKSLVTTGHSFDPRDAIDEELREYFLPVLTSAARTSEQADWYVPKIHYLNDLDLEKMERDREKDIRRKKRLGRARLKVGVLERDPPKTQRTMPGATEINFGLPPTAIVTAAPSRRAAAQAASATIANLAAAENTDRPYPSYYPPVEHTTIRTVNPVPIPISAPVPTSLATPSKKQKAIILHAPPLKDDLYISRAKLELTRPTQSTSLRPSVTSRPALSRARGEGEGPSHSRSGGGSTPAKPHSSRPPTAKEINDAKIKEYAEGLHPVMINGKWHCSVCGCPEEIAIGRRKGPLGEKTMCGDCGKFYHRHRRPNDQVEYNTDPEYHLAKRKGTDDFRRLRRRGALPSRLAAESASAADTPTSIAPAETPISDDDDDDEDDLPLATRTTRHSQPPVNPIRIISPELSDPDSGNEEGGNLVNKDSKRRPMTSASNSSLSPPPPIPNSLPETNEPPAVTVPPSSQPETEKTAPSNAPAPAPSPESAAPPPSVPATTPTTNGPRSAGARPSARPHVLVPPGTPDWLKEQLETTLSAWPQDDFGGVQRPPQVGAAPGAPPEWRIKCFDCPGMLYKPGPGQTLENFVVHLRNRNHRNNVAKRLREAAEATEGNTTGES